MRFNLLLTVISSMCLHQAYMCVQAMAIPETEQLEDIIDQEHMIDDLNITELQEDLEEILMSNYTYKSILTDLLDYLNISNDYTGDFNVSKGQDSEDTDYNDDIIMLQALNINPLEESMNECETELNEAIKKFKLICGKISELLTTLNKHCNELDKNTQTVNNKIKTLKLTYTKLLLKIKLKTKDKESLELLYPSFKKGIEQLKVEIDTLQRKIDTTVEQANKLTKKNIKAEKLKEKCKELQRRTVYDSVAHQHIKDNAEFYKKQLNLIYRQGIKQLIELLKTRYNSVSIDKIVERRNARVENLKTEIEELVKNIKKHTPNGTLSISALGDPLTEDLDENPKNEIVTVFLVKEFTFNTSPYLDDFENSTFFVSVTIMDSKDNTETATTNESTVITVDNDQTGITLWDEKLTFSILAKTVTIGLFQVDPIGVISIVGEEEINVTTTPLTPNGIVELDNEAGYQLRVLIPQIPEQMSEPQLKIRLKEVKNLPLGLVNTLLEYSVKIECTDEKGVTESRNSKQMTLPVNYEPPTAFLYFNEDLSFNRKPKFCQILVLGQPGQEVVAISKPFCPRDPGQFQNFNFPSVPGMCGSIHFVEPLT